MGLKLRSESSLSQKPTLYIGLTCAAGTDLTEVKQQLRAQLSIVGYEYKEIKVSAAIAEALEVAEGEDYYERTVSLMDAGDRIRAESDNGSGVASLIVTALRAESAESNGSVAYVIDSLKNPKEHKILDQLYGRNFYSISVFASPSQRRDYLANKIARSREQHLDDSHRDLANKLTERDQKGKKSTGQGVRATFPKADFFVDRSDVESSIKRFVRLIFQDPFITPTIDEYMMFIAKATSLRSCDLSRQVGAVIADSKGAIISTGCNEVPYPGGGFFYEGRAGEIGDNRDKEELRDPNFNEVTKSISQLIEILKETGNISDQTEPDELAHELLHGEHKDLMEEARLRNLIEFSRVVHAEMQALTQAAQLGRAVDQGVMYCTTYPCHLCARHIISSGIDEVVYIEPYPKSLTDTLYQREIVSEHSGVEQNAGGERVVFRSFRGVSPTLFQRVFSYKKRKDQFGAIAEWNPDTAWPAGGTTNTSGDELELFIANQIAPVLEKIHNASSASCPEA